jgi:hypothetical protein
MSEPVVPIQRGRGCPSSRLVHSLCGLNGLIVSLFSAFQEVEAYDRPRQHTWWPWAPYRCINAVHCRYSSAQHGLAGTVHSTYSHCRMSSTFVMCVTTAKYRQSHS